MSAIVQALGAGYSAKKILSYLSQHNPQMASKITAALNAGHTIDHILNYIQKNSNRIGKLMPEKGKQEKPHNIFKQAQSNIHPSLKGMAETGLAVGSAAAIAYAMSRAIPTILGRTGMQGGISQGLTAPPSQNSSLPTSPLIGTLGQQPQVPQSQLSQQTQQSPLSNANAASIPEPSNIQQHEEKNINIPEILSKHQSKEKIDELINAGNTAEGITAYFQKFAPKQIKDIEKESGLPFSKAVEQYIAENPQQKAQEGKLLQEPIEQTGEKIDFTGIGKGITDNLYNGLFESLKKGSTKFAGIEDPVLKKAKEPFEKGLIKSPEDLRRFVNELPEYSKKTGKSQIEGNRDSTSFNDIREINEKEKPKIERLQEIDKYEPSGNDYTLSKEHISKWYSAKPGEFIGNLKDFFTGDKLREKFKDVLSIPVYKGFPDYRTKGGQEAHAGYGEGKIVLNSFDDKSLFPILTEEASHALQDIKGRLGEESESDYEENINEKSAKKHVDYLNKFHEKEKSKLKEEESKRQQDRIAKAIAKHDVVSSPQGIGEVKEIRNGQAIVEVDGKLTKVKEEDLQPEPEEVKKAKIEFNLEDVPEDLRSAPLNEVYAPAHRKHVTIKYNSDVGKDKSKRYIFFKKDGSPVDEDIIQKLREGSQLPVTSNETFWGAWNAKTQDSRGTVAYHELSKLAQKEGEEDDPSKPYWFEEEEEVFTHGYSKMAEKKLKEEEKKFNEAKKKRKKKTA